MNQSNHAGFAFGGTARLRRGIVYQSPPGTGLCAPAGAQEAADRDDVDPVVTREDVARVATDGGDDLLEAFEVRADRDECIRQVAAIDGVSQGEVADAFGVSQAKVSQVVNAGRMATLETEGSA